MGWERNRRTARLAGLAAIGLVLGLGLGACSSNSVSLDTVKLNVFGIAPKKSGSAAGVVNAELAAAENDTPCPDIRVRTGAATLMIGSKPGPGEPAPLDVRYQGSIVNTARECHLNAGLLSIKVGIEGRVITGPAGGPGTIDVPLRVAVVHEGINPTTITTKLAIIPVTVNNAVDRVTFTHVEPDIAFPMPQPTSAINSYVIYVGFDPLGAKPQKPARRSHSRRKPRR